MIANTRNRKVFLNRAPTAPVCALGHVSSLENLMPKRSHSRRAAQGQLLTLSTCVCPPPAASVATKPISSKGHRYLPRFSAPSTRIDSGSASLLLIAASVRSVGFRCPRSMSPIKFRWSPERSAEHTIVSTHCGVYHRLRLALFSRWYGRRHDPAIQYFAGVDSDARRRKGPPPRSPVLLITRHRDT